MQGGESRRNEARKEDSGKDGPPGWPSPKVQGAGWSQWKTGICPAYPSGPCVRRTLGKEGQSRLDAGGRLYHPEPAFQCVRCHESGSPWGAPRGPSAPPALDSPSLSAQTGHRAPVPTSCWWANPTSLCLGFLTCTRGYINLASGCWEHHLT